MVNSGSAIWSLLIVGEVVVVVVTGGRGLLGNIARGGT